MTTLSRKTAGVVLAALATVAGCASQTDQGGGAPPPAAELPPCPVRALDTATGPVEVLVWYQLNAKIKDTFLAQIDRYNASQNRVKVRAELQGADYDELLDAYKRNLPSRHLLPDIVITDETATRFLVDSGTVVAAQKCFEADNISLDAFNKAAVNYYTIGGAFYPASVSLSNLVTYYNKAHFRRAGLDPEKPPATLAEARSYAQKLKAAGVTDKPIVMKLAPWFVETELTGAHQALVDNDNGHGPGRTTKAVFDTDTTRTIYQWVGDMVRDGLLNPKADTPGQFEHFLGMAQQSASISMESCAAASTIAAFLGGDRSVAEDAGVSGSTQMTRADLGVAPVFGVTAPGKTMIGGNAMFITNTATEADQAGSWDFMKWWNRPEQQKVWYTDGSYLPFLTAAAQDPQMQAFYRDDSAGQMLKVAYEQLETGMDPNFTGPVLGPYFETREILRASLDKVGLAGGDPDAAIDQAVTEVDKALATYNEGL